MRVIYKFWAWLFGWPALFKFNLFLFFLSLRGMGVYNYTSNVLSGERWLIKNVLNDLGDNLLIFDVGANVGNYSSSLINDELKIKKIYAFEPHPKTFSKLKFNAEKEGGIVIPIQAALSDNKGEMLLYDRADYDGSAHASFSSEIFQEVYEVKSNQTAVNVDTVDSFCERNGIQQIDLLKIDVEGYELNVLQGARNMLANQKIRLIQFEFTQLNSTVGVFFKQIYDLLSNDYSLYRLLPHGMQAITNYDPTSCEIYGYQNFAAILKPEKRK